MFEVMTRTCGHWTHQQRIRITYDPQVGSTEALSTLPHVFKKGIIFIMCGFEVQQVKNC